jgi:DNA processing protein
MLQQQDANRQFLLHLSLIPQVGPIATLKMLRHLHAEVFPDLLQCSWMDIIEHQAALTLSLLYDYSTGDFVRKLGFSEKLASTIVNGLASTQFFEQELALMFKHRVRFLTVFDSEYPEILKQIHAPPLVIYLQGGRFDTTSRRLGFVGSRLASPYAEQVIKHLIPPLIEHQWVIVSGGAEGADTMAHETTLASGGKTVAVLGSGLMYLYPASNKSLFQRIIDSGGIVMSPFPLRVPPDRGNFPARNRIISGLSLGCVIVQAAQRSGALITANFALEQGRQVFAVPGPINESLSDGCHTLIKQGAKLVNTVGDIVEEFGEDWHRDPSAEAAGFTPCRSAARDAADVKDPLLMHMGHPLSLDELSLKTGMDVATLQDKLFMLQLEGKARQLFTGMWERL